MSHKNRYPNDTGCGCSLVLLVIGVLVALVAGYFGIMDKSPATPATGLGMIATFFLLVGGVVGIFSLWG